METIEKRETFVVSVNLSIPFGDNVYQLVYGSQLYGTTFTVYARIDSSVQQNNTWRINQILLKLVNYRGCVNLGIVGTPYLDPTANKPVIIFHVKALTTSDEPVEVNLGGGGLEVRARDRIIFQRRAVPFLRRKSEVDYTGNASGYTFFDTEFNYRDGFFESFALPRAGHIDATDLENEFPTVPNGEIASPRCHQSFVLIAIK